MIKRYNVIIRGSESVTSMTDYLSLIIHTFYRSIVNTQVEVI